MAINFCEDISHITYKTKQLRLTLSKFIGAKFFIRQMGPGPKGHFFAGWPKRNLGHLLTGNSGSRGWGGSKEAMSPRPACKNY